MDEAKGNKEFIYEFGKFVLDPHERVLLSNGKPIHLTDKVFDTLLLLIRNNGRLLTKDEMMTSIWDESFVEESNLAKNISRLRKILNLDGVSLIETMPKHGYRFSADLKQIDGDSSLLVNRRMHVRISQTRENGDQAEPPWGTKTLNDVQSIAVLPFQPLDAKVDDGIFGLGLTDALITQLNRAGQIQVRPTSSILKYDVLRLDPVSAGKDLQVDAILEGKFQRVENKLRLTVQLLHAANGDSLWADAFNTEADDIFTIQDRIAEHVIGAFNKKLTAEIPIKSRKRDTENVAAYREYLRGLYFQTKRTTTGHIEALECFQRAIDLDPLYAVAYAGIADIYNLLPVYDGYAPRDYFPKAKAAALKALAIDPELAEAHAALGFAVLHYDWNFSGAEVSFQHAIKLNPNYSRVYELLGVYLLRVNRLGEAIVILKKANDLDPLSPINAVWLAEVFRHSGNTEASIRLHQETLISFPDFYLAHYHLAFSYIDSGLLDEAEAHCEQAVKLSQGNSLTLSLQGILRSTRNHKSAARETLNQLLRMKEEKYISSVNIASVYAALGDEQMALEWLETALSERDPNLTWITFDKEFQTLEQNARFQEIVREVGFVENGQRSLPRLSGRARSKGLLLAACGFAIVLIAVIGIFFYTRGRPPINSEKVFIRLTDSPRDENHPHWTNDGRIRFLRIGSDKETISVVMNSDGTNQTEVRDFSDLKYGVWSPDGTKVIFAKPGDRTAFYVSGSNGADEIRLPFFSGNFDWSLDGKKIVYQLKVSGENSEIFVYSFETGKSENITNNPAFDADPSFSPNGRQVVFVSLRDGNAEIYVMNVDGSDVRRLTDHPAWDNHPVFSPDGTTIAFDSDRDGENSDVYLMSADGSGIHRLTDWKTNESIEPGCWSPDGTKLAFVSDRDGNDNVYLASAEVFSPRLVLSDEKSNLLNPSLSSGGKQIVFQAEGENKTGELRIFDTQTRQTRVLRKTESFDIEPALSPDGEWIAFQDRIENNTEICLIKTDGSGFKNLTQNQARDISPAFSPDGKQIAFASNRDGNFGLFQLFVMNSDGSDPHRVFSSNGTSGTPAWSPDGKSIVFANDKVDGRNGNFELFKIEPGTDTPEKRLTFRRLSDSQPAFSPDGKQIAFASNTDGNTEIYLMNSDGTGILRLTRNPSEDNAPQFSSDGKRIIFSSNRNGLYAIYEIELGE